MLLLDQASGIIINLINGANFPECVNSPKTLSMAHAFGRVNSFAIDEIQDSLKSHSESFTIGKKWFLRPEHLRKKDLPSNSKRIETEFSGNLTTEIWQSPNNLVWYLRP